jgi:transglutaminase-like putative cysteine protease
MTMYPNGESDKDSSFIFFKNCNIRVKDGEFSILQYDTVLDANEKLAEKGAKYKKSRFKDKKLSDVKNLLFKDPVTKKVASVTDKKVKYFKKVATSVTKGAETDYEKVLKIYEYVAKNFYYDDVAFSTGTKQYVDPYRNLYNLRNKKKSANSTDDGKVATVCSGMAGVVVALCRQLDIPARVVNGHHISLGSSGYQNWETEENIDEMDHWWAEVYVDGRWIVVDPTPGNSNKWNRSKKTWTYTGITNYVYFDPTPEQLATSHITFTIKSKGIK